MYVRQATELRVLYYIIILFNTVIVTNKDSTTWQKTSSASDGASVNR